MAPNTSIAMSCADAKTPSKPCGRRNLLSVEISSSPLAHNVLHNRSPAQASNCGTSPTRASSSPPTTRGDANRCFPRAIAYWCPGANKELAAKLLTRRCIAEQIDFDGPQMFDMALNSPPKALQRRGRFRERSPGDPEETKSEPPEGVADAWSLEDWGRTAEDLVKEAGVAPVAQEFVALSDLRHALEPLIASHMEQMTSWVVAEMAFARDGFKEDMKRSLEEVADHHRIEVNSIRGVCTSLSAAIVESAAAQPRFTAGQLTAESVAKRLDRVDAELRVHAEKMEEMRFRVESTFADLEVGMASNQILQETRSSLELARAEFFAGLDAKVRSTTFAEELLSALEMARAEIRNGLATKLDSTAFIDASRSMDARTAAIGKQLDDLGVLRTELRAEMNSLRVDVDARAADSSARLEKVFAGLEADRAWKAELSAWMHGRLDEFGNSLRETGKNMEGLVGWMQETSAWLQQAGAREQVLMQVVTHLAEESSPTLHNLCEATFGS